MSLRAIANTFANPHLEQARKHAQIEYRLATSRDPEQYDFMFLLRQDTREALCRIPKRTLAIALGSPNRKDCPQCREADKRHA